MLNVEDSVMMQFPISLNYINLLHSFHTVLVLVSKGLAGVCRYVFNTNVDGGSPI